MKYKLHITYPDGSWHVWNQMPNNEWELTFEDRSSMMSFLTRLLGE